MENIIRNEARRDFLKVSGSVAGGLALGFYLPGKHNVAVADAGGGYASPNAWVKIGADNAITIMVARSEMGQDVYTSMPMLVAEELEVGDLHFVPRLPGVEVVDDLRGFVEPHQLHAIGVAHVGGELPRSQGQIGLQNL